MDDNSVTKYASSDDKKLLDEAKERYKIASEYWAENHKAYLEDVKFRAGEQWPEDIKKLRSNRPTLVVDKCNQYVRQVVNDGRQNRPTVKVHPVDDGADEDVAEVYQGIIRHICNQSHAATAFDTALDCAAGCGFGYVRVKQDYVHDGTFEQELLISQVENPLAVKLDPFPAEPFLERWGFVEDRMSKEQFKLEFPKAKHTNWEIDSPVYGDGGWLDDNTVMVCECYYQEKKDKTLLMLADGQVVGQEEYEAAMKAGLQDLPEIHDTRIVPSYALKWCRMSGAEILEKRDDIGSFLPIVRVEGNKYNIEGKIVYSGLIRGAKDAQRLYNYSRSAFAERVALTPKSPWVAVEGQIEDYSDEWETANTGDHSVLRYKQVDLNGNPAPPPRRESAADIPAGFAQDMQISEHDIQGSMGMYNASLGERSNETSGKAIIARDRQGDIGTFHYHDNQARAIAQIGTILVERIPKVYDSRRVIRIMGEDGTGDQVEIDPDLPGGKEEREGVSIYNLNAGRYDVTVSTGPSYTTKRQEAAEGMVTLVQANPALMQIVGDIMVRNLDWPGADEIAERLKLMLPPQIQQAEQKEGQQSPEVQQVMAQAQAAMQQKDQTLQQMDQLMKQMEDELSQKRAAEAKVQMDYELGNQKFEIEVFRAQTERMKAEADIQAKQIDNSGIDVLRLEFEDKWQQLQAETKILIEQMKQDAAHMKMCNENMMQEKMHESQETEKPGDAWEPQGS